MGADDLVDSLAERELHHSSEETTMSVCGVMWRVGQTPVVHSKNVCDD